MIERARPNSDYAYGIRKDGSRCWPMQSHPYSCGGGKKIERELCPKCCFPAQRACALCGARTDR